MSESSSPLVLVVDDEEPLARVVEQYLVKEHFRVICAYDGRSAIEIARRDAPDVVVLDLMLPGLDGIEVCRQLRTFSDAYVIMLTARSEEIDKLVGLAVGADDYLTKPFSPRELIARVRALLRRPRTGSAEGQAIDAGEEVRYGELILDLRAHEVRRSGQLIQLTPTEFKLLETLASQPRRVFTRELLLEATWGIDFYGDDRVVDTHISNLRHKIEVDPLNPTFIQTVRGVGYRWEPEPT